MLPAVGKCPAAERRAGVARCYLSQLTGNLIADLEPPWTVRELRQYLGVASWYRRFVPDFAKIVKPLNDLLRKGKKWVWTQEHQTALEEVKARHVADLVLACPDFDKPLI